VAQQVREIAEASRERSAWTAATECDPKRMCSLTKWNGWVQVSGFFKQQPHKLLPLSLGTAELQSSLFLKPLILLLV